MKKILNIAVFVFIIQLFSFSTLSAASVAITNDEGVQISNGDVVCANNSYYVQTDAPYNEIVIVDANTHMVLKVLSSNNSVAEIYFPENATDIEVYVTPYDENRMLDFASESKIALRVEPCYYEQIEGNIDYDAVSPQADVSYSDSTISIISPTNLENYELEYQFLGQKPKVAKTNTEVTVTDEYIFQFKESYTQGGQTIENYYELEINPATDSYYVRNVDSFEIKTIKPLDVVNQNLIFLLFLLILALIYVRAKIRSEKILLDVEKIESRRR